jgi:plasmid stability protein
VGTLTVRNLDDGVQRRIRLRAAENGRSMEAEARAILSAAVSENRLVASWLAAAADLDVGLDDFELPARSAAREPDLA